MALSEALLPEYDQEMAVTRRALERAPGDQFGWKPHEKSMSLGYLASHLAQIPQWGCIALDTENYDVAPPDGEPERIEAAETPAALLAMFDDNAAKAREAIAAASDGRLMAEWTLLSGAAAVITLPRIAVLRSFVMNHSIHHRGQLSVYYRLLGVPVPAMYGPSADEQGF